MQLISSVGNCTIAVVKEKEYNCLRASLANVTSDVNAVAKEGHITVDGQQVNLEFYLGGDYKVNGLNLHELQRKRMTLKVQL